MVRISPMDPYEEFTRRQALGVVLDRLEAALRSADHWDRNPPAEHLLESSCPFCFDTLSFEQWVQWQMIPRMRRILGSHEDLPESSAILPYAEECLAERQDADELLRLIDRFDALIGWMTRAKCVCRGREKSDKARLINPWSRSASMMRR